MTRYEAYEKTIERYANSNMYSVYDAYQQPSEQKVRAERMIHIEMDQYNGYDYRILSYNTFRFTCAYKYEDMNTGEIRLRIHTSDHVYDLGYKE